VSRPFTRRVALGVALLSAGASAADAGAAAVSVNLPCQVARFGLTASLSGFTPNSTVSITGNQIFRTALADATGSAVIPFDAPMLATTRPGAEVVTLAAADNAPVPLAATTTFRSTNFAAYIGSGPRSPRGKRTWEFSGFRTGRPIYGHFRYHGLARGNFRFGVAHGACGQLTRKAAGIPVRGRINTGIWTIQVDQKKLYNPKTRPFLRTSLTVFKVLRHG
jgi:hypothetical protein